MSTAWGSDGEHTQRDEVLLLADLCFDGKNGMSRLFYCTEINKNPPRGKGHRTMDRCTRERCLLPRMTLQ